MSVVQLNPGAREAGEALRHLADRCDAGEIVAVSMVYETSDGAAGHWLTECPSRLRMAGMLLDVAVARLGYIAE